MHPISSTRRFIDYTDAMLSLSRCYVVVSKCRLSKRALYAQQSSGIIRSTTRFGVVNFVNTS
jgi:hypothetical protein